MKHFLIFVAVVFLALFLMILNRNPSRDGNEKPILRIYAYSSFTNQFGPGPVLKKIFESTCDCQVEFSEGSDAGILLQRLKIEGESLGADLVIGFDQSDLQKALVGLKWQQLNIGKMDLEEEILPALANSYFVPYDWGTLSFMGRKGLNLRRLDDLLRPELAGKLLLQDPRTSSPGFQFLQWVIQSKGEEAGFKFIEELFKQNPTVTPSWSAAINLFNKSSDSVVFTYVTSPLYYQIEEKKNDFLVYDFQEALPLQVEFVGIPDFCRRCELSEKFVNLMLSKEGQRVLMEKNYMLPVIKGVRGSTLFANVLIDKKFLNFSIPSEAETDRLLRRWSEIRRGH